MDAAMALTLLKRMVAYDTDPQLTEAEVTDLLAMARMTDENGRKPDDAKWLPTYDLNLAAAEGWRWKAAKAVSMYDFSADGGRYDRSQVIAHCRQMAAEYARRVATSAHIASVLAARPDWIINLAEAQ